MDAIFETYAGQVAPIRIHVYWPSPYDPFWVWNPVDNMSRKTFYGFNYVPTIRFDGKYIKDYFDFSTEDDYYDFLRHTLDSLITVPSPMRIKAEPSRVANGDSVRVSIDLVVDDVMTGGQQVYLVVTETAVETDSFGTHYFPMRDIAYRTSEIYLRQDDSVHYEWSYAIPDSGIDPNRIINTIWVQQTSNKAIRQGWSARLEGSGVDVAESDAPLRFVLGPNRPNPFNPSTTIRYELPAAGDVRLTVHDVTGRLVATLADAPMAAGDHATVWDGRDSRGTDAPSGVYFARLRADAGTSSRKIVLVR